MTDFQLRLPLLLAFDFDGTLVHDGQPQPRLSEALVAALHALQAKGAKIAVITGRDILPEAVRKAFTFDAMCTQNGGQIEVNGKTVRRLSFSDEELDAILQHQMPGAQPYLFADGNMHFDTRPEDEATIEWLGREALPTAQLQGSVQKVNFFHEGVASHAAALRETMPQLILTGAQPPYPHMLTITPAGAHKGAALALAAEALGVPLSQTVVFGDSDNDVPMFEEAGWAVASGDLPLLRAHANEQIAGPDELPAHLQSLLARLG